MIENSIKNALKNIICRITQFTSIFFLIIVIWKDNMYNPQKTGRYLKGHSNL